MYWLVELDTSKILFPQVISEWKNLIQIFVSSCSYKIFRNALLKSVRGVEREIFNSKDPFGTKMLTRLRLGFSHLCDHSYFLLYGS